MIKKLFSSELPGKYWDFAVFLVIFGLMMTKYCAYGFAYWPQLDDYIQYHNYAQFYGQTWETVATLGMLAARPLAGLADLFFWSNFFDHMIWGLALISVMYAASAVLLRRIFTKYFGTGILFVIFLALFPLVTEGTYWMSAATRVVTGLFFAVSAGYFFVRWLEKKRFPWLNVIFFMVFQLLAYGFYEQVLAFSAAFILLLAFLERKTARKRLWLCLWSIAAAGIYFAITSFFSDSALYSGRIETVLPNTSYYWNVFLPEVLSQLKSAFLSGGFYILCKGFVRGAEMIAADRLIRFALFTLAFTAVLWYLSRNGWHRKMKRSSAGASLAVGILLALAPLAPFFITANTWFSLRGTVLSMVGIALIGDTLLRSVFVKCPKKLSSAAAPILCWAFAVVFVVAGVSEVSDYRNTHQSDLRVAQAVLSAMAETDTAELSIGVLNVEPTYLSDQNVYYHEHIHGVTESQWAFTGALRCIGKDGAIRSVTPLPSNPVYEPWNAEVSRPETFDLLYYYDAAAGTAVPVTVENNGDRQYLLWTEEGIFLGRLWEEDGYGYWQKGPEI